MHHLLFLLAPLLHLTIAIPTPENESWNIQQPDRDACADLTHKNASWDIQQQDRYACAHNDKMMKYKKEFYEGFCTARDRQIGPSDYWMDDMIPLDFNFDYKSNICGFHVFLDLDCLVCARQTIFKESAGTDGIACVSQDINGGVFGSLKAAPCDGRGIGCWKGGMLECGGGPECEAKCGPR